MAGSRSFCEATCFLRPRASPRCVTRGECAMPDQIDRQRPAAPAASFARAPSSRRLEPLRHVDAGVLNIAYYEAGPADGPVVMLMHGFPYDIHSFVDVAP